MRWDNLFIAGLGAHLPRLLESAADAVAEGRYPKASAAAMGYRSARIADAATTGPVMAVGAARDALAHSGLGAGDIDLVLHSYLSHQGLEFWTPASYVQRAALGPDCTAPAIELRQGCNGGLSTLDMAVCYLASRPDCDAALLTGGDAFRMPYLNRWASDDITVYGDGAGAVVLSTRSGFARVLSIVSQGDPAMELMERGTSGFTDIPFPGGRPICSAERKREYLMSEDEAYEKVLESCSLRARMTFDQALREAGRSRDELRFFIHQTIAESLIDFVVYEQLGVAREITSYDWGLDQGMLGTMDVFIGLQHVLAARQPEVGDLIALMGVGAGSVWTVAVLEIVSPPALPDPAVSAA